jgi:UDP-glucose 4-epimerase
MNAIITGGAGFIGYHLNWFLKSKGWNTVLIDDFSTHSTKNDWYKHENIIKKRVQEVELHEIGFPIYDTDVIFHLAGKVGPTGVIYHKGYIATDTIASADIAGKWAAVAGCPLIDISTSEVYGSPDEANSETTPKVFRDSTPRMEYAVAKLAAETMLINRENVDVRIIRPFNVTGWGQQPDGGFVLPRFAIQAISGQPLTVYAPGTQVRAFTSVKDVVAGIWAAYLRGKTNEVYNLGNSMNACSISQLAHEIRDRANSDSDILVIDPRELHGSEFFEAPDKLPNASKAALELGWVPEVDRGTIIDEVLMYWSYNVHTSDWAARIEQQGTDR